jgi:hypothetical protein
MTKVGRIVPHSILSWHPWGRARGYEKGRAILVRALILIHMRRDGAISINTIERAVTRPGRAMTGGDDGANLIGSRYSAGAFLKRKY